MNLNELTGQVQEAAGGCSESLALVGLTALSVSVLTHGLGELEIAIDEGVTVLFKLLLEAEGQGDEEGARVLDAARDVMQEHFPRRH